MHKEHNIVELIEMQHYGNVTDEAVNEIDAIIKNRAPYIKYSSDDVMEDMVRMAIDLFLLGYIHGKRAERARRAKKTTQTA